MSTAERTDTPTCPHCGYALDYEDMQSGFSDVDLFALAPNEDTAVVMCPNCDSEYAVRGGYKPFYVSALSEDEL